MRENTAWTLRFLGFVNHARKLYKTSRFLFLLGYDWQIKVIQVALIDGNEGTKHEAIEDNNNEEIHGDINFLAL